MEPALQQLSTQQLLASQAQAQMSSQQQMLMQQQAFMAGQQSMLGDGGNLVNTPSQGGLGGVAEFVPGQPFTPSSWASPQTGNSINNANPNAALGFGNTQSPMQPNNLNQSAFALSPMLNKAGSLQSAGNNNRGNNNGNNRNGMGMGGGRESSATNGTLAAHQAMGQALVNQLLQSAPSKTTSISNNNNNNNDAAGGGGNGNFDINQLMSQLSQTSSLGAGGLAHTGSQNPPLIDALLTQTGSQGAGGPPQGVGTLGLKGLKQNGTHTASGQQMQ